MVPFRNMVIFRKMDSGANLFIGRSSNIVRSQDLVLPMDSHLYRLIGMKTDFKSAGPAGFLAWRLAGATRAPRAPNS